MLGDVETSKVWVVIFRVWLVVVLGDVETSQAWVVIFRVWPARCLVAGD